VAATAAPEPHHLFRLARSRPALVAGLIAGAGVLLIAMLGSIALGAADVAPGDVWAALFHFDPASTDHLIIRTLRVPRATVAALVGAALAVAGALMQGLTRNPLGDPGILGINAGAALAVVSAVALLDVGSLAGYALFAFAGAALTAIAVYSLGALGQGGPTPLRLTIAGAALTALLSAFTTGILLLNQLQVAPYLLGGLLLAWALGPQITTIALGEDVAKGLGQRTGWVKGLAALAVVLLAGASVAVAGPIGFVGLVIPHVARWLAGVDYRWILPYAALLGAIFLVLSDVAARMLLRPLELPLGVVTALIGGPFFIYLVRWRVRK
jgi:iron complex transport system permease protein